jgi:hypothetical protein
VNVEAVCYGDDNSQASCWIDGTLGVKIGLDPQGEKWFHHGDIDAYLLWESLKLDAMNA